MKKAAILLTALAIAQCAEIKGNPTEERTTSTHLAGHQGQKVHGYYPRSDWSYFHPSWSLPSLPSISSMTSFFKDEDDDNTKSKSKSKSMIKRIEALEKNQKEILELLKKISQGQKAPEGTLAPTGTSGSQSSLTPTLPNVVTTTTMTTNPDDKRPSKIKDSNESSSDSSESVEVPVTDDRLNPEDLESGSGTAIKSTTDHSDLPINGMSQERETVVSTSTDSVTVGNPEELGSSVPEFSSVSIMTDEPKVTESIEATKNTSMVAEIDLKKSTDSIASTLKNEDSSTEDPSGQSSDPASILVLQNNDRPNDLSASVSEVVGPEAQLENQGIPEETVGKSDPSISQLGNTDADEVVTKALEIVDRTIQVPNGLTQSKKDSFVEETNEPKGDQNEKLETVSTESAEKGAEVLNVKVEEDIKNDTANDKKEAHAEEIQVAKTQDQTINSEGSEKKKEPFLPTSIVLS